MQRIQGANGGVIANGGFITKARVAPQAKHHGVQSAYTEVRGTSLHLHKSVCIHN